MLRIPNDSGGFDCKRVTWRGPQNSWRSCDSHCTLKCDRTGLRNRKRMADNCALNFGSTAAPTRTYSSLETLFARIMS